MKITVYLGAGFGNAPFFAAAAKELGAFIGKRGDTLVYGGSKTGLMGILADSVLAYGGKVIGVEPKILMERGVQHEGLTQLIVTENISERKAKMIEMGDAFLAFPGANGTLDEIAEVMSLSSLNLISQPCILYDLNGYYGGLRTQLETMKKYGLSSEEKQKRIYFAETLSDIEKILDGTASAHV